MIRPYLMRLSRLSGATIALTNKVPIRKETLDQLPNLKMIAVAATGYDVIDIGACKDKGVSLQYKELCGQYSARTYICIDSRSKKKFNSLS